VWGSGPCLGCGPDTVSLRPRLLEELQTVNITDIVCGDSHCLALTVGLYNTFMLLLYCFYGSFALCSCKTTVQLGLYAIFPLHPTSVGCFDNFIQLSQTFIFLLSSYILDKA